jgi:hypothetical protein
MHVFALLDSGVEDEVFKSTCVTEKAEGLIESEPPPINA